MTAPETAERPLRLPWTPRDRAAMRWMRRRLAQLVRGVGRRRKTLPPGGLTDEEVRLLRLLCNAQDALLPLLKEVERHDPR